MDKPDDVQMQAFLGVLRAILAAIGGYLVNKGIIGEAMWHELIGVTLIFIPLVWSVAQKVYAYHKHDNQVAQAYISGLAAGQRGAGQ